MAYLLTTAAILAVAYAAIKSAEARKPAWKEIIAAISAIAAASIWFLQ